MFRMLVLLAAVVGVVRGAAAAEPDSRVYEMRVYYAPEGKLEALNARFRDHTLKLFEKHGITSVGYWEPIENPDRKLIYILSYPSREAAEASWKAFRADPEWQKAQKASEENGKLVAKAVSTFLKATDYSAEIKPAKVGDRVFELRTYTASEGNLDHLHARFRDHTCKLFAKHGITNVGYWSPMEEQPGAKDTLVYIVAHKSPEGAKASFGSFGKDPEWTGARKASEEKAGGSLTVPMGVKSEFLKATDYSPIQ
jgi:hypothetical protein